LIPCLQRQQQRYGEWLQTGKHALRVGSHIEESGLLLQGGSGLILRRDDGGQWRLDAPRKASRLIGRRVTIKAKRSGFDLLDVDMIYPEGRPPAKPYVLSWQFGAGAATAFGVLALIIIIASSQ
jgi:hypothetical protein